MPAPQLRGYTRETVVVEKFEAMVRLGLLNNRMHYRCVAASPEGLVQQLATSYLRHG